jgi:hypothetical protein
MPRQRKLPDNWAFHFSTASVIAANGRSGKTALPQALEIECKEQTTFQNLDIIGNESDTTFAIGSIRISTYCVCDM